MVIRISLGNVGSGKTANEVREMVLNKANRQIFSNIHTKGIKHCYDLNANMILKREVKGTTKKKDGTVQEVVDYTINQEFWQSIKDPCSVVLDEFHIFADPRNSMSKRSRLMMQWVALIRRVLGSNPSGEGELVIITQLPNRVDVILREMAHQIRYHVGHFDKQCQQCKYSWHETSEASEPQWNCPRCGSNTIKRTRFYIEIWHFTSMARFMDWRYLSHKTYHRHYLVRDIEQYFPLYNTLQWDNLFENF